MYIIEVIPLIILPSNVPQLLSYFFNKSLQKGTIVEIPFGNRKVRAVVVASATIEDQKILLKKTGFQLKKVSNVTNEIPQISNNQFKIALWLSRYYYAPLGYCLKTVLPSFFLKKGYETTPQNPLQGDALPPARRRLAKPLFLLSNAKETLTNLLPLIKKVAENQGQVALIVPDTSTIEYFYQILAKNYEVVKISSSLSNKNIYDGWKKVSSGQAEIILGARQALFMSFNNLKLLIVDDVLHEFYKSEMTPKYNTPDLAKTIASLHGAKIIFVSPVTGVENYYHLKNKEYELLDKIKTREPLEVINMADEVKSGNFSMFSEKFKEQLLSTIIPTDQNKKVLIFSPRRGYSGLLVCQNCGYAVKCKECEKVFRVHKTTDLILVCHHCSRSIKMPKNCPRCNSFKLKTAGPAGTQKIYDETQRILMVNNIKIPILIMDTDVIKNETEEEEILQEIKSSRTSIIISTQMIFSHRYDLKFDLIGILNADSMISAPDFRAEEKLFYQVEKLLDFLPAGIHSQSKNMIIQTYNPENRAILTASKGNYKDFYNKELEIRKVFSYPPYFRLIKLTFKHRSRDKASYESRILSEKLKMVMAQMKLEQKIKLIDSYPPFIKKEGGLFVYNIVLKILPELENIRDILKYVPSNWSIDIDPRSII